MSYKWKSFALFPDLLMEKVMPARHTGWEGVGFILGLLSMGSGREEMLNLPFKLI